MLKIFGHKSPDTDSTCTPIVYSWFLTDVLGESSEAFVLGEPNREAKFVLKHLDIETPEILKKLSSGDKVIIIDTNNPEELPETLGEAEIVEIIDHHKLAGLTTNSPISVTMKPLACTATIVWQKIKNNGAKTPKHIAGLLLAAILSDTLKFASPTTTREDEEAAQELSKISGIEIEDFVSEMFAAKSDLTGMSVKDILLTDSKIFNLGTKKARVSTLETTKPENAMRLKNDLISEMSKLKSEEKLDLAFFFIVDIIENKATLIVPTTEEEEVAEQAFDKKFEKGILDLPGVVSRKKQIIPNLEKALA